MTVLNPPTDGGILPDAAATGIVLRLREEVKIEGQTGQ
jgi:hypothetical protein